MHVINVRERQEGMQERLDRWAPRSGIEQGAGDQIGHLLIAHFPAIAQRDEFSQPQPRIVREDRATHVRTRSLDPHHLLLAAEVVDDRVLGRSVATAVDDERGILADPIGTFNQFPQGALAHAVIASATRESTVVWRAGSTTPCSVTMAEISRAGVTSNAGL